MLLTAVLWLYQFIIFVLAGFMVMRLFMPGDKNNNCDTIMASFMGIAVIGTICAWSSLFIRTGLEVNIAVWLVLAAYAVIDRAFIAVAFKRALAGIGSLNFTVIASFSVLFIIILAETSLFLPKNYDTALYHAQAIRWSETFPAVPGLGNLHERFAYNSSWLPLTAFFSFSWIDGFSCHNLNGFILMLITAYFIRGAGRNKPGPSPVLKLALLPFALALYLNFSSSPGTDSPAALLVWIIAVLFLEYSENPGDFLPFIIIVLSSYAVTVKLAAAPVMAIPLCLFIIIILKKDRKDVLAYLAAIVFIIAPWIIRNYIISGYLIYPVLLTGFVPSGWKMPVYIVNADINGIKTWSFAMPPGMQPAAYLYKWLAGLKTEYKALLYPAALLSLASIIHYIFYIFRTRAVIKIIIVKFRALFPIFLTAVLGIVFLFLSAPDFRYGAAFFLLLPLCTAVPSAGKILSKHRAAISTIYLLSLAVLTASFDIYLFHRYFFEAKVTPMFEDEKPSVIADRLLLPSPYYDNSGETYPVSLGSGVRIYLTSRKDRCWYARFPCVPFYRRGLALRGTGLNMGFMITNN